MAAEHGDEYLEALAAFTEQNAEGLLDGSVLLKLKPLGLLYLDSRFTALSELEALRADAPVDYLRAVVAELGDYRKLEKLRAFLRMLERMKIVGANSPLRDSVPLHVSMFSGLRHLEIYGCDLSTAAAKGLLDLKPQLETLICIDSTDSLADLLADRGASLALQAPWLRLTRLVCLDNQLRLMDPSLCLLPAVEEMDLSRNKLTTVANLHNCVRLRRLDLGFNSIASLVGMNRVVGAITQLILRGNGIHSLAGLEKLYAIEELDLAHNVIGLLSEVARLGKLPSLTRLWLEGNPIELRRNYRPEVLSLLQEGDKIELDGLYSSTFERFIIRSRQKRNAHRTCYPEPLRTPPAYSITTERVKAKGHTVKSSRIADPSVVEHVPDESSKPSPKPSCLMEHPEEDPERMFSPKVLLRKDTRGSGRLDDSEAVLDPATSSAEEELLSEPSLNGSVNKPSPSSVNASIHVAAPSGPSLQVEGEVGVVKSKRDEKTEKAERSLILSEKENGSSWERADLGDPSAEIGTLSTMCGTTIDLETPGQQQSLPAAKLDHTSVERSYGGDLSAERLEEARACIGGASLSESCGLDRQSSCKHIGQKLEPPSADVADSHMEEIDTPIVKSSLRLSANETASSSIDKDTANSPVDLDALSGRQQRTTVKGDALFGPEPEAEREFGSDTPREAAACGSKEQPLNIPIDESPQIGGADSQAQNVLNRTVGSVPCLNSSLTKQAASPSGQSVVGSKPNKMNGSKLRKARIVILEPET